MACDKGVSKLPAPCNCHPHVGKVIPAEGLVLPDSSWNPGLLYESIAVDPCPGMGLFLVLVFSGEDHLRVLFHWLLLLDLDGMTVHAKTVGCSLREAQTEFDTEFVAHIFSSRQLDETMPSPQGVGSTLLSAWSLSFIRTGQGTDSYLWLAGTLFSPTVIS